MKFLHFVLFFLANEVLPHEKESTSEPQAPRDNFMYMLSCFMNDERYLNCR